MQILTRFNKVIAYSKYDYIPIGNSAVCAATNESYDDVLIVTVDCIPTDIDYYDYYYVNGRFIKGDSNSVIREINKRKKLQFFIGTKEEYNALPEETRTQGLFAIFTDDNTDAEVIRKPNTPQVDPSTGMLHFSRGTLLTLCALDSVKVNQIISGITIDEDCAYMGKIPTPTNRIVDGTWRVVGVCGTHPTEMVGGVPMPIYLIVKEADE